MQRHYLSYSFLAVLSAALVFSVMEATAANDTKGSKADPHQTRDKTTTKSKLEGRKKGEGDAAFRELNSKARGGGEATPDIEGAPKSGKGGASPGTGPGTGTTGTSGGSGSGGSGSGGN